MVGSEAARQFWELAEAAKDTARQLIDRHRIECDLKPGIAHPNHKPGYARETEQYVEFLKREYDYQQIEYLELIWMIQPSLMC